MKKTWAKRARPVRLAGLAALLAFLFLLTGTVTAAETVPAETPPPAKIARPERAETETYPAIIDRTADPQAWPNFRFKLDAELLEIWFPNILNADEAILQCGGETWLIDCGDEKMGQRGAELIRKLGIEKIDRLFNTHPHHDHLKGLEATQEAAPVQELLICFGVDSTDTMVRAMKTAEKYGIQVTEYGDGDTFRMGEAELTFYVNGDTRLDMNNRSAQTMIRFGERTIWFSADMEKPGQISLLERLPAEALKADILKYPHHGKGALYEAFREAVDPQLAVITNYQVDWEGFKYLKGKGIPYAVTNTKDTWLHLATDGEYWLCEYIPRN